MTSQIILNEYGRINDYNPEEYETYICDGEQIDLFCFLWDCQNADHKCLLLRKLKTGEEENETI